MIILGLIDSKPSTAAIYIDGKVVSAISEERLCRMKMALGMPRQAITQVIAEAGIAPSDIDLVAVAQKHLIFQPTPQPWLGWFKKNEKISPTKRVFRLISSTLAPIVGGMPIAWEGYHTIKNFLARSRHTDMPNLLREAYGITAPVKFYDHHYCHATSAYYPSGFEKALVITLDGGGDSRSGSVYVGENGRLRELASVDSFNSLGNIYSYVTELCGFRAELHEGKITGLAAIGKPTYLDILKEFIEYREPGQIRYKIPMYHKSALGIMRSHLPENFDHADLAASVQVLLEEIGLQFIQYWLKQTGLRNIAVSGGVFANVKFNQRVHELDEVDNFFVYPPMVDSGLAVGGALAGYVDQPGIDPTTILGKTIDNLYYGPAYTDDQIEQAIKAAGFSDTAHVEDNIQEKVADLIAAGSVVARFTGGMEYGPRALGHRSVLYQTNDPSVNDWLNDNLKRTEFMPFAPATLEEYADQCFNKLDGARDPARFMTITFECTPYMGETSPGVVHIDNTARPQIVDAKTAPDLYQILSAYHQKTGIPSIINTSFNMHGEPIVCSPEDALRSFEQGHLEYLAIGNWLVSNPAAKRAPAEPTQSEAELQLETTP